MFSGKKEKSESDNALSFLNGNIAIDWDKEDNEGEYFIRNYYGKNVWWGC